MERKEIKINNEIINKDSENRREIPFYKLFLTGVVIFCFIFCLFVISYEKFSNKNIQNTKNSEKKSVYIENKKIQKPKDIVVKKKVEIKNSELQFNNPKPINSKPVNVKEKITYHVSQDFFCIIENSDIKLFKKYLEDYGDGLFKIVDSRGNTPLIIASWKGQAEIVKYLLDENLDLDIEETNKKGNNALIVASQFGHLEVVKFLLKNKANINAIDKWGNTPLMLAIWKGHLELANYLIDNDADINIKNIRKNDALLLASQYGYFELVKKLIEKGANKNSLDKFGNTPIILALWQGHLNIVEYLLAENVSIENKNFRGNDAFLLAAQNGYLEIVKSILAKGANKNSIDIFGNNALILASWQNCFEVVEYLLLEKNFKAIINTKNKKQNNALLLASQFGYLEIVEILLANGADIESFDIFGNTPLLLATWKNHFEVSKALVDNKANLKWKNKKGNSVLSLAVKYGQIELIKILLESGADVDEVNFLTHETPLLIAVNNNDIEMVKLLLANNADSSKKGDDGFNAFLLAVRNNNEFLINHLLEKGGNIFSTDNNGNNALLIAAESGYFDLMFKFIEKHKMDINSKNKDGFTAIQIIINSFFGKYENSYEIMTTLFAIKKLIKLGGDLKSYTVDGETALTLAIANENYWVVRLFAEENPEDIFNYPNRDGDYPIFLLFEKIYFFSNKSFKSIILLDQSDIKYIESRHEINDSILKERPEYNLFKKVIEICDLNVKDKDGNTFIDIVEKSDLNPHIIRKFFELI